MGEPTRRFKLFSIAYTESGLVIMWVGSKIRSEVVVQNCKDVRYESFRLDDEEISNSATGFDDSSDENSFVEKIVDDIVFVVAEEIVDENL